MSQPKLKILFCDDDLEMYGFFSAIAETLEFEPLFAADGLLACHLCEHHHAEIVMIVSDFQMPELNGFELKSILNEKFSEIPFILSSGQINTDQALAAVDLGIKSILSKPYKEEEMVELIRQKTVDRIEEIHEDFEMKAEFQGDAESLAREVEEHLLELESHPENLDFVNKIMRLLHTIKGTSACLSLHQLSSYTHKFEDYFGPISRKEKSINRQFITNSLSALDTLNQLINEIPKMPLQDFDLEEVTKVFSYDTAESAQSTESESDTPDKTTKQGDKDKEINVSIALLDEFMEQSGELTVLKSMIVKQVQSLESEYGQSEVLDRLVESLEEMNHVSGSIQNKIVEIRKIPVKNVFRQLPRVARDTCRATGKDIQLEMTGQNLRIDQSIGDALQNILVHMVRNSIDHGCEKPDVREELGKPKKGTVKVDCSEDSDFVTVTITDDGAGVNPEKIRAIALKKGLYSEDELIQMTDQRAQEIIFEPGFSTAEQVSDISGRGVGMDMVFNTIKSMSGQIFLKSIVNQGSKIELVFPVPKSVLIIKALFVKVSDDTFCINQEEIERIILVPKDDQKKQIEHIGNEIYVNYNGNLIPIFPLKEMFGENFISSQNQDLNLVILKHESFQFAVQVDEIMENEEIVVKNIDQKLRDLKVFTGATFLGDGRVALVLQSSGILEHQNLDLEQSTKFKQRQSHLEKQETPIKDYLVFEGFHGEVGAVPLMDVFRLETFEKRKMEFILNQPILRYLQQPMPLTTYFEKIVHSEIPEECQLIVQQTSQGRVGFLIKDILDIQSSPLEIDDTAKNTKVLGSIFLNNKTTQVLNVEQIALNSLNLPRPSNEESQSQRDKAAA